MYEIKQGMFGYDVIQKGKFGSSVVACGFRDWNKARNYAWLLESDQKTLGLNDEEYIKLQNIQAEVCNQYCSWVGFVENVTENGLRQFLEYIKDKNMSAREIVNQYI
jgi:hypothetical protein